MNRRRANDAAESSGNISGSGLVSGFDKHMVNGKTFVIKSYFLF